MLLYDLEAGADACQRILGFVGHIRRQFSCVGQLFVPVQLFLHAPLVSLVVNGAEDPGRTSFFFRRQLPESQLQEARLARRIFQGGPERKDLVPEDHFLEDIFQAASYFVRRLRLIQHRVCPGVPEDHVFTAVIDQDTQRKIFDDTFIQGADPVDLVHVLADGEHHQAERVCQLAGLVCPPGVFREAVCLRASGIQADAGADLRQIPEGGGDVVGNQDAGLYDDQKDSDTHQDDIPLFLDAAEDQLPAERLCEDLSV